MAPSGIVLQSFVIITVFCLCHGTPENVRGEVSSRCDGARTACTASMMTRSHCRSTWHAFQMDMIRLDTNNDCTIDGEDMEKNFRDNFNLEDDDRICRREWMTRNTVYLGLSTGFAKYLFDKMYPSGCGEIDEIESQTSQDMKTDYLNSAVKNLIDFCGTVDNQDTNLDCWNLPSICKEKMPTLPACRQYSRSYLTLGEQLQLYQSTNDANNDGVVTSVEMSNNFRTNYDRNGDGCVTRQEFILRWTNHYRFSRRLADTMYSMLDTDAQNCLNAKHMQIPRDGSSADSFQTMLLSTIIGMCQNQVSLYNTVRECALVGDTCQTRYANYPDCRKHYGDCGLESYLSCINRLPDNVCSSEADLYEIKFEKLKVYNQINETCTEELMNGSQRLGSSFLFTLVPVLLAAIALR